MVRRPTIDRDRSGGGTAAPTLSGGCERRARERQSAAAARTIPTMSARARPRPAGRGPIASESRVHRLPPRPPPARAMPPAAIAGATIGTTARFTSGATIGTRPNQSRAIGSVAASAASETPSDSQSQPGQRRRRRHGRSRSVSGVAQAMSPPVAAADRANPGSVTSAGPTTSSPATAQPSAAAARPGAPVSRASSTTAAMTAARRTEADAPVRIV